MTPYFYNTSHRCHLLLSAIAICQVCPVSKVCVPSCITNFIIHSDETVLSISDRGEPILKQFQTTVKSAWRLHDDRLYLIAPSMSHSFPRWYHNQISEVLQMFSTKTYSRHLGPSSKQQLSSSSTCSFRSDSVFKESYIFLVPKPSFLTPIKVSQVVLVFISAGGGIECLKSLGGCFHQELVRAHLYLRIG